MARAFEGTGGSRIEYAAVADLTGSAITVSFWLYNGWTGGTGYAFVIQNVDNTAPEIGASFNTDNTRVTLFRTGTTSLGRSGDYTGSLNTAWHNVVITHDGTFTDYTTIHIYFDGVESVDYTNGVNGANETAATGKWVLGGRTFDTTRNMVGKLAEFAIWNRVLSAGEIATLANRYSPMFIQNGLKFYIDLVSGTGSRVSAAATSVTGTTVFDHPPMRYPIKLFVGKAGGTITIGTTTWGHVTGVIESNVRTFSGNWTGTGQIDGSGDSEKLSLNASEYMISEMVNMGAGSQVQILQNNYAAGSTVTLEYRQGASTAECGTAAYSTYTGTFVCSGYVQVRVTSTL